MRTCWRIILSLWLSWMHVTFQLSCMSVEPCKCLMSDQSGYINLKSLASTSEEPRWTLEGGDGYFYKYNPCVGFDSLKFTDLAILQVHENNSALEYNLGIQSTEQFTFSPFKDKSVTYGSSLDNPKRSSEVILECIPDKTEHELEFVGELIVKQYEFLLKGPCACVGLCDDQGVIEETTPSTSGITTEIATNTSPSTDGQSVTNMSPDCQPADHSGLDWNEVGNHIVALLLHDVILVATVTFVLTILKFALGYSCFPTRADIPPKLFSNS